MTMKPLNDHLVITFPKVEETTASGIILATQNKEKSQIAEVVSVGPGTADVQMQVKPGDKILTNKYGGTEVKLDDKTYTIIKMSDVLAIVE